MEIIMKNSVEFWSDVCLEVVRRDFTKKADGSPAMPNQGGPNFRLADPGTWPEQADLAATNRWRALAGLQQVLNAGKR